MFNETTTPIRVTVPDRPIGDGRLAPQLKLTLWKTGEVTLEATEKLYSHERLYHNMMNCSVREWYSHLDPGDVAVADPDAIEDIADLFQPLVDRVRAGSTIRRRNGVPVMESDADAKQALHEMDEEMYLTYPEDWVLEPKGLVMGKRLSGTGETSG